MGMFVVERSGPTGEDLWSGFLRMAWTGRAEARVGADRRTVCYRMAAEGELRHCSSRCSDSFVCSVVCF